MGFLGDFFQAVASIPGNFARGFLSNPRDCYLNGVASSYIEPGPTRFHHRESEIIVCGTPADAGFIMNPANFENDYAGKNLPSGFLVPSAQPGFGWYACLLNNNVVLALMPTNEKDHRQREVTSNW